MDEIKGTWFQLINSAAAYKNSRLGVQIKVRGTLIVLVLCRVVYCPC
jgi:hypothetical protein